MAVKRKRIPRYSKVQVNGHEYYKTDIEDADGKRVILYGKTREEVYDKEMAALEQIDNATFRRKSPTVAEYCEKWLLMQSVHIRATTLIDYTSKVRRHIIKELGEKRMADVTLDDIQVALVPVSKKSASVYKSVVILYKSIFRAAKESHVIRPMYLIREEDIKQWRDLNGLHFIQCACRFTDTCSSCRPDGTSASKRMEIKQLISELKKVNPFVEGNIFKSVENVNLSTIIAYKQNGQVHHFLDTYNDQKE